MDIERDPHHIGFRGRIVVVGFGSTGRERCRCCCATSPIASASRRHARCGRRRAAARCEGVATLEAALTRDNHSRAARARTCAGRPALNLSVGVSSVDLIVLCRERGALYLDTSVEPWHGQYTDAPLAPAARTNYALREAALALRRPDRGAPTALLTHGANPGLASHFVKQALLDIARDSGDASSERRRSRRLGAARRAPRHSRHPRRRARHAARAAAPPPGEFVNTWSVDAFIDEALQPSELGWGSHERALPVDGVRHEQAAAPRSTCSDRERARACAAGCRGRARSRAS
jgi:homospermidine synthase